MDRHYVVSGWQSITVKDNDPNTENSRLGLGINETSDCNIGVGGRPTMIFYETCRENGITPEISLIHEIGHALGLSHGNQGSAPCGNCYNIPSTICPGSSSFCPSCMGIMSSDVDHMSFPTFDFIDIQKNLLRSRRNKPGR